MQRNVWLAIPAYTGQVHLITMRSIVTDLLKLAERGDRVHVHDELGNALIADCRGLIVETFLESDGTDLVFIDSDVSWEAGKLLKLVDQPVDLRVGIYPHRRDPLNFSVRWDRSQPDLYADPATGLLAVDGAPAGCMVMSRAMLERMRDHYGQELDCWNGTVARRKFCALFDPYWMRGVTCPDGTVGDIKLGEDYSFCQRWLDMGGKVWVDPEMQMGHTGYKTFIGSLGDWLRDRMTINPAEDA